MTVPGDETAPRAGIHGNLRTSRADREQVIDVLKAAFVQERLTKDEFDLRIGQVLASRTYAELAAVTADIPAGLIADQPPGAPVRVQARHRMGNPAKAAICVAIAVAVAVVLTVATNGYALRLFVPFYFLALLAAAAQMLASRHDKHSRRRQLPPQQPPQTLGQTLGQHRPASAKAGQEPQIDQAQRRTAMASLPYPSFAWFAAAASGAFLCAPVHRRL